MTNSSIPRSTKPSLACGGDGEPEAYRHAVDYEIVVQQYDYGEVRAGEATPRMTATGLPSTG